MCDVNSCNVFPLLFMALSVPISVTLFRRAMLTLWHTFMFLGLRFFVLFFSFCLVASTAFSCKKLNGCLTGNMGGETNKGKSDKRITESKARQKEALLLSNGVRRYRRGYV
jgi:hypothetical protein